MEPTPYGYQRVVVSSRRGRAHLVRSKTTTTVCGLWAYAEEPAHQQRRLCLRCKRGASRPAIDRASEN